MSNIKELYYLGYKVNYEVYGKGEPLLILNGIMMSTKSWHEFLPELTKNNQVILVDFLDQGETDSYRDIGKYSYTFQTEILKTLFEHLKLKDVSIASISYGGIIAIDFASKYSNLVKNLILFNSTAHTSEWMIETYKLWNEAALLRNGSIYYKATIPSIYSKTFYKNNLKWMKERESILIPLFNKEVFLDRMIRLTNSIMNLNILEQTRVITANTLIVASEEDYLTPVKEQLELSKKINNSSIVILPNTGHALMYENKKMFISLILGFIS